MARLLLGAPADLYVLSQKHVILWKKRKKADNRRTLPGHRDGGKIGLTQCAERSWLPGLPPARINGSGSSDRLRYALLCHFFFHFSEDSLAEHSLLVFAWHNTIIMSCSESQEWSI